MYPVDDKKELPVYVLITEVGLYAQQLQVFLVAGVVKQSLWCVFNNGPDVFHQGVQSFVSVEVDFHQGI